jgi:hypothetical protein
MVFENQAKEIVAMTSKSKIPHEKPRNETEEYLGTDGAVSGQGRSGGRLARDVGTRDELKRSNERPAGKTRVLKGDEKDD